MFWPACSPTQWGKSLGQTMIVENVTGAAGSIGVSRVARAVADGYTLSIGTLTSHVLVGGLYKLDFDLLTDLTPISELAYEPLLICVKNVEHPPEHASQTPGKRNSARIFHLSHRTNQPIQSV